MIWHLTLDSVARAIDGELRDGSPSPFLLWRFYRAGKRQGRQGLEADTMFAFIGEAVDLAGSMVVSEYVGEVGRVSVELHDAYSSRDRALREAASSDLPEFPEARPASPVTDGGVGSDPDLRRSLEAWRAKRLREQYEAIRRRRQDQHDTALSQQQEAETAVRRAEGQLRTLYASHRQRLLSCHEAGRLLWRRYCLGYGRGVSNRGVSARSRTLPSTEMHFALPTMLAGEPTLFEAEVPVAVTPTSTPPSGSTVTRGSAVPGGSTVQGGT